MEAEVSKVAFTPMSSVPGGGRLGGFVREELAVGGTVSLLAICLCLAIALAAAILVSASFGAVKIPVRSLFFAALGSHTLTDTQHTILFAVRLPRVLASAVVGAALGLSGLMFQGLFRNPMADPYIIGASGGAAVGACIGIVFLAQFSAFGFSATALLAFVGAVLAMVLVYSLARTRGRTSGVTLLLAGFAVGTMLSNSTYLFDLFDPNPAYGHAIVAAWLHGVIGIPAWRQLGVTAIFFGVAALSAYPLMRRLNTLALGDEYAQQLGMRVEATRVGIILVGSLLTAIAVSLGGLISFAGLIVPHVVRLLVGPDHLRLLPVTLLTGAIFLVVTDTLARVMFAPTEIPVGILMVFLGAPFFLYLLRNSKREYSL
jgi:iron complex transport system permease protein